MRQTQIRRVPRRRRAIEPLLRDAPIPPGVDTAEALAVLAAIDAVLAEAGE